MSLNLHPLSQEELMAYLDGELPVEQAVSAAAHLEHCRDCQQTLAELCGISHQLAEWHVEPPDSRISDAIRRELDKPAQTASAPVAQPRSFWKQFFSRPLVVSGSIGISLALVGIFVAEHTGPVYQRVQRQLVPVPEPQTSTGSGRPFVPDASDRASGGVIGGVIGGSGAAPAPPVQARLDQYAKLQSASAPMIIRLAELRLITPGFDGLHNHVEQLVAARQGYIAHLQVNSPGMARSLSGSLRVPAPQLDAFVADLKRLGHVESESQHGEDVTQQYVDLEARLSNLRTTEQRLNEILRQRTGRLSDVLAVEEQVDRVRGEIESMEASRKRLSNQISYAAVQLTVNEEYRTPLSGDHISSLTRLRNAAVQGYRRVVDGSLALLLFLLSSGPALLVLAAILFFPARAFWRVYRRN
jgi:hypothetical protein